MTPSALLTDAFTRILEGGRDVLDGLSADQVRWRPEEDSNPIGWIVWHLARVQDDHVAGVADSEQVYTRDGFTTRFDLPYPDDAIGYGQNPTEVGAFEADAELLLAYLQAVHERTVEYLATLEPDDLDAVVDADFTPPVTRGARLVSVVNDDTQHVGQAAYVRGLLGL